MHNLLSSLSSSSLSDINECEDDTAKCKDGTYCDNTQGSFLCQGQSLLAVICSALTPSLSLQIVIECVMVRVQGVVPVGVSHARTGIRWRMEDVKVCGS